MLVNVCKAYGQYLLKRDVGLAFKCWVIEAVSQLAIMVFGVAVVNIFLDTQLIAMHFNQTQDFILINATYPYTPVICYCLYF